MAALIGKALAKRVMKDAATKNINSTNPFEEEYPILDNNGRETGKTKTRKRGFPPGLSKNDEQILKKVRKRAYRLDMSLFNCCGIRFGWSSVIGIVPVIGDFIDCFLAMSLVRSAQKVDGGLPATLKARMTFNIMLDFCLGLIPLLGDVADAVFRANTRNAWLLEMYLTEKMKAETVGQVTDPDGTTIKIPSQPGRSQLGENHHSGQPQGVSVPNYPTPAKLHATRQEPVREQPGIRSAVAPIIANGGIRRPDVEMARNLVDYGVQAMGAQRNLPGGNAGGWNGGHGQTGGRSSPRTKEDIAFKALQYGGKAALDAYNKRQQPAGWR